MGNVIARIPLTGGPKGGKTKIKEEIKKQIEKEYNCKVFVVPETATEVIKTGFIPASKPKGDNLAEWKEYYESNYAFQLVILILQLAKEQAAEIRAKFSPEDVVIIYDRGVMDNEGYVNKNIGEPGLFDRMLAEQGLTREEIMARYDGVISLESSALIQEFKDQEIDDITERLEDDSKEAMEVDKYVSEAWEDHPNYMRIAATENFEDKIVQTVEAVKSIINKNLRRKVLK